MFDRRPATYDRKTRLLASVALYVALACLIYPDWRNYERLAHIGSRTTGHVLAKEPNNHQFVRYRYQVDGHDYAGIGDVGGAGLPTFEEVQVGDSIPIRYRPDHPGVSFPGDADEVFRSWSSLLFGVAPLFSLAFGIALGQEWLLRRR